MELRGHRRANKPQSGLFSRHYSITLFFRAQGQKARALPLRGNIRPCVGKKIPFAGLDFGGGAWYASLG